MCVAKGGNRKLKTVYPDEREGRVKDANKKLKAQVNSLKKQLRQAQEDVTTLRRAFNKSCNYIQHEHNNYSLEEVIEMVNSLKSKENKDEYFLYVHSKGASIITNEKKI